MAKNYYLILGLAADASREDIKAAFRRRALELHPDRSGLGSGPFQEVQEAYRVLGDPERRRRYDRTHPPRAPRGFRSGPAPEPLVSQRPKATQGGAVLSDRARARFPGCLTCRILRHASALL